MLFINSVNLLDCINLQVGFYLLTVLSIILIKLFSLYILLYIVIPILTYLFLNNRNQAFLGDGGALMLSYIVGYLFIYIKFDCVVYLL